MAYEGGYTSAVNAATDRERIQTGTKALLQQMAQQDWLFQQQQQRQRDLDRDLAGGIETYLKAFGKDDLSNKPTEQAVGPATPPSIPPQAFGPPPSPPQIPFPGMPSIPNLPPQIGARPGPVAAPGGPPGAPPATPVAPGAGAPPGGPPAPPGVAPQAAPPAAPAAPPAPPPGWQPSPAAGPNLGGPAMPPGAPPGMGGPGARAQPAGIAQGQMYDPLDFIKTAKERGVPPLEIARQLQQMLPVMNEHNATVVKEYAAYAKIMDETNKFLRAQVEKYKAESQARNVESLIAARTPEHAGQVAAAKFPYTKAGHAASAGGGTTAETGKTTWGDVDYSKMSISDPKYDDRKATAQFSDRQAAWRYNFTGVLPYRKGTGGGKDANERVKYIAAQEAMRYGYSPEEISALPFSEKSDLRSLTAITTKYDTVSAILRSLHNNIDTWQKIGAGLPPTYGKAEFEKIASTMRKIDFSDIKTLNDIQLKVAREFSDPTASAYVVAAVTVAMDVARIRQGAQSVASLTEGQTKKAMEDVATGLAPAARDALAATLVSESEGNLAGLRDQMKEIKARMMPQKQGAAAAETTDLRKKYGLSPATTQ